MFICCQLNISCIIYIVLHLLVCTWHVKSDLSLNGLCNSHWASSVDDWNSTSDCAIFLVQNLISWKSSKQCIVVWSFTKVEYKAIANVVELQ